MADIEGVNSGEDTQSLVNSEHTAQTAKLPFRMCLGVAALLATVMFVSGAMVLRSNSNAPKIGEDISGIVTKDDDSGWSSESVDGAKDGIDNAITFGKGAKEVVENGIHGKWKESLRKLPELVASGGEACVKLQEHLGVAASGPLAMCGPAALVGHLASSALGGDDDGSAMESGFTELANKLDSTRREIASQITQSSHDIMARIDQLESHYSKNSVGRTKDLMQDIDLYVSGLEGGHKPAWTEVQKLSNRFDADSLSTYIRDLKGANLKGPALLPALSTFVATRSKIFLLQSSTATNAHEVERHADDFKEDMTKMNEQIANLKAMRLEHAFHGSLVSDAAWSADGRLAFGDLDKLYIYSKEMQLKRTLTGFDKLSLVSVAWSADGRFAASDRNKVYVYSQGMQLQRTLGGDFYVPVRGLAWSPDGRLAVATKSEVRIYSEVGRRLFGWWGKSQDDASDVLNDASGFISALAWSADGRLAVADGKDPGGDGLPGKNVRIYSQDMQLKRTLHVDDWIHCLAWSPDGRLVLGDTSSRTWQFYSKDLQPDFTLKQDGWDFDQTFFVAWSADGRLAAAAHTGLRIYSVPDVTKELKREHKLRDCDFTAVSWSAEGRLATVCHNDVHVYSQALY